MLETPETNILGELELNAETIERLSKSRKPQTVTVNGKVQAVVVDARSYQELLEKADYAETVQGIRQGMKEHGQERGIPLQEAIEDVAKDNDITLTLEE